MDTNNRLFRFSKPEWLNNAAVRNSGVSVAGALVSDPPAADQPDRPVCDGMLSHWSHTGHPPFSLLA
jgi:hypothetical protein